MNGLTRTVNEPLTRTTDVQTYFWIDDAFCHLYDVGDIIEYKSYCEQFFLEVLEVRPQTRQLRCRLSNGLSKYSIKCAINSLSENIKSREDWNATLPFFNETKIEGMKEALKFLQEIYDV